MVGTSLLRQFSAGDGTVAVDQCVKDLKSIGDANDGCLHRLSTWIND